MAINFLNNPKVGDNTKIEIGTGSDLQIYHDGSNSFITNSTGDFTISNTGDDLILKSADDFLLYVQGSELAIQAVGNAGVVLRYNNVAKFETTSTGVTVPGTVNTGGGNAATPAIIFEGNTDTGLFHPATDEIGFSTAGSERMRITSAGNLAIGTTSATSKLTISDNSYQVMLVDTSTSNRGEISVEDAAFGFYADRAASTADSSFFWSIDNLNKMEINLTAGGEGQLRLNDYGPGNITGTAEFILGVDSNGNVIETSAGGSGTVTGTGAATRVAFWSSTTALSSDANLYWDNTNDRLGIGTTSPGALLEIFGTGNTLRLDSAANGSKEILFRNVGTGTATIKTDGDLKLYAEDANKNILFETNGGEAMRISSAGQVLIGQTSFGTGLSGFAQLEVSNATAGGIVINTQTASTSNYSRLMFTKGNAAGNEGVIRYNTGDYHMSFWTNAQEKIRITSAGNVGIGTTAPVSSWVSGFDPSTGNGTFKLTSEGWIVTPYLTGLASYYPSQGARPILWADAGGTNIQNWDDNATDGVSIKSHQGTTRLFVRDDGNVGIGTTAPSKQLEILYPSYINKDTVQGLIRLIGQSNTENSGDVPSAGVGIEFYNKWTGGLPYSTGRISARSSQSYDGGLQFDVSQNTAPGQTNFITAMSILDTGNVGIGTTAPAEKLQVAGSIKSTSRAISGSATAGVTLSYDTTNSIAKIETWTSKPFSIETAGAERMRITSAGNVGIGTTSPASKLHIYQNSTDTSTGAGITIEQDGTGDAVVQYLLSSTRRWTAGVDNSDSDRFKISSSADVGTDTVLTINTSEAGGRVGIGTTAPAMRLDVQDNSTTWAARILNENTNGAGLIVRSDSTTATNYILAAYGNGGAGAGYKFVVQADGKTGIGTSTPNEILGLHKSDRPYIQFTSDTTGTASSDGSFIGFANADGFLEIRNKEAQPIRLSTSDTERMRIDSAGNVGIGVTAPNAPLDVLSSSSGSSGIQQWSYNSAPTLYRLQLNQIVSSGLVKYSFDQLNAGTAYNNVLVLDTGKVGIGTTAPGEKLEVVGNSITRSKTRGIGTNYATPEGWVKSSAVASATGFFGGNFAANGGSSENKVEYDIGPFGSRELVWMSIPETGNNDDGGWNKGMDGFSNSSNNGFMSVIYVRRDSGTPSGNFYHGCSGTATNNLGGSANTNPYFNAVGISTLPADVWCVAIGIIYANNDSSTATSTLGGIYRLDTGQKISAATTFRQKASNATQIQRVYHYYSTNTTAQLDFARPGFYIVDGSEPSLSELLNGGATDDAFWSASGNDIYNDNSGNVGIGTTSPAMALHVSRSGTTLASVGIGQTGTAPSRVYMDASNGDFSGSDYMHIGQNNDLSGEIQMESGAGAFNIKTGTGSPTRFTVLQNGNVGIGLTAPVGKLHVSGSSSGVGVRIAGLVSEAELYYYGFMHDASDLQGTTQTNAIYSGGTIKANTTIAEYAGIRIDTPGLADGSVVTNNYGVYQSSNLQKNYFAGNVGIGTSSPGSKLEVYQNINSSGSITISNPNAGTSARANLSLQSDSSTLDIYATSGAYTGVSSWTDAGVISSGSLSSGGVIINSQSGGIKFQQGTVEKMRITNAGNVGIGATSPGAKLEVVGDSRIYDSLNVGYRTSSTSTTNYEPRLIISGKNNYSDGTTWYGNYGQLLLTCDANMTSSARRFLITNALDNNKFAIVRSASATSNPVVNSTAAGVNNGTADFVIDNTGKIGIGTSSPSGQLDVSGDIWVNGDNVNAARYLKINRGGTSDGGILLYGNGSLDWQLVNNSSTRDLLFYSYAASSTVVRIQASTGNVGIGTTNPTAKLTVVDNSNILSFNEHGSSAVAELKIIGAQAHDTAIYFGDSVDNVRAGFYYDVSSNQLQVRGYNNSTKIAVTSAGRVGIGTTNPGGTLDVDAPSTTANSLTFGAAAGQIFTNENSEFAFGLLNASPYPLYIQGRTSSNTARDITLQGLGGNIGIGVTAPSVKLHVASSNSEMLRLQSTSATGSPYISFFQTTNRRAYIYQSDIGNNLEIASEYGGIKFLTGSTGTETEKMVIQANGTVGIGTTNPVNPLQVTGKIYSSTDIQAASQVQAATYRWSATTTPLEQSGALTSSEPANPPDFTPDGYIEIKVQTTVYLIPIFEKQT